MKEKKVLTEDMQYLTGRIDALTSLVLAIAGQTMSRESFLATGNMRLESLEGTLLNTTASESRLLAIAHTREWLNSVAG